MRAALWRHRVLAGTCAIAVFHLAVSSQIPWPSVVFDEAGYLGNARWLAGDRNWEMPFSPAYASGYPLLLTPWFALTDDPDLQLRGALLLNAVLLALLFPTIVALGRRLADLPEPLVIAAAALGALTPAVIGANVSAIAENLVLPVAALTVLAAWGLASPNAGRVLPWTYGPLVGLAFAAHPRFTAVVAVALLLLVGAAAARWVPWTRAAANLVGLTAVTAGARALNGWVVEQRWRDVQRPEGEVSDWVDLLTSRAGLAELVKTTNGQVWYVLVGSLGISLVGLAAVAALARRPHPDEQIPEGAREADAQSTSTLQGEHRARRLAAIHLLASTAAVFATSVAFFARNQFRIDHFTYGRHNDTFAPLLLAAGVAALLAPGARRWQRWWLPATAVPLIATAVILNLTRDPRAFEGRFSPFAAPAIARAAEWQLERAFVWPTLVGLAGLSIVAALVAARRRDLGAHADAATTSGRPTPRLRPGRAAWAAGAAVAIVGGTGLWSGIRVAEVTETFAALNVEDWNAPADLRRLGVDHLAVDSSALRARAVLNYPFALPEVEMSMYDGLRADDPPRSPWVLTTASSEPEQAAGSRVALLDSSFLASTFGLPEGLALWVRPGAQQDQLDARGRLLPDGFPSELPATAQRAELEVVDLPAQPVTVPSGGRVDLDVRVRHIGAGSPWPDRASWPLPGHVRLVALVEPVEPGGVRGARSGGQLGQWMLPGDEVVVAAEIIAIDEMLEPLPAGRYRVTLAIAQEGRDWLVRGGQEAQFELEVTG